MQRLASTVAIAVWIGFLAVFSFQLTADLLAPGLLADVAAFAWPKALTAQFDGIDAILNGLAPTVKYPIAFSCLALVALLSRSLFLLHASRGSNVRRGEMGALAAIGLIGVLAGAAQATGLPLLPIDLGGGNVWLALALSIAAIVFDRLVAIEKTEDGETDAEFQAGLSALAERMGRQAALYTLPQPGPGHPTKSNRP